MKNLTKIFALVLVSNLALATTSNEVTKKIILEDNIKTGKLVSYANPSLIKSELGTLSGYSKNIQDEININNKIVEKVITISDVAYVSYANDNNATEEIKIDLPSTTENIPFVNYSNTKLLKFELGNLKNTILTLDEIIKANQSIIDNKTSNVKIQLFKNQLNDTLKVLNPSKY